MSQTTLPFQLEQEQQSTGLTAFAGLSLYLELIAALDLPSTFSECVGLRPTQGWTDSQQIIAMILLQLAGGKYVEDIDRLEADSGLSELIEELETKGLSSQQREQLKARWRIDKQRSFPSADAIREYLEDVDDGTEQVRASAEGAFVPQRSEALEGLVELVAETGSWTPPTTTPGPTATLDFDATIVESHKRTAKETYKEGIRGFQPHNVYWAQLARMIYSEFRDGNCPAGWNHLEMLKRAEAFVPDDAIEQLQIRADTAGYNWELLKYCADDQAGEFSERFGVIEFAVSVEISESFRESVREVDDWTRLSKRDPETGELIETRQEWAEVPFVPEALAYTKRDLGIRFLAIREPLTQTECLEESNQQSFNFPTIHLDSKGRCKLFGVVDNRPDLEGDEVIRWHRKRGGASEQAHSILKTGLAAGQFPSSDDFQADAAWWQIGLLAYNLHVIMSTLVFASMTWLVSSDSEDNEASPDETSQASPPPTQRIRRKVLESAPISSASDGRGEGPRVSRMKTERFEWLGLAGRLVRHARCLTLRLDAPAELMEAFHAARRRIATFARGPPTRLLGGV